ncbi:FAD-dependent thymidylate synthase [SAR202 cluster bacterium AD-802-E10_MRT_200m]|nr:FAD-dependent thymidylate synthase [SAR202 cluster bacterium AD-802-E10_MRT_200m]
MEHAIQKLLSSDLEEERQIGDTIKSQGRKITPTLIRYADENSYLIQTREEFQKRVKKASASKARPPQAGKVSAKLLNFDEQAEAKLATSLLYHYDNEPHYKIAKRVQQLSRPSLEQTIKSALGHLGPHDSTVRELEFLDYTFEFVLDYGAYREFKRHRMHSYIPQNLTVELGYIVPQLIQNAGLESLYLSAMQISEETYRKLSQVSPRVAEYVVTHAHLRRVISKMNLRECYHFFKLRTQPQAHFTIQEASRQALEEVRSIHPLLVDYIQTRE